MARRVAVALAALVASTAAGLDGTQANNTLVASLLSGSAVFNSSVTLRLRDGKNITTLAVWESLTLIAADDGVRMSADLAAAARVPAAIRRELAGQVQPKATLWPYLTSVGTGNTVVGLYSLVAANGTLSVALRSRASQAEQVFALPFAEVGLLAPVTLPAPRAEALNATGAIVGVAGLFPGARFLRLQPGAPLSGELQVSGQAEPTAGEGWQPVQSTDRLAGWVPLLQVHAVSTCGTAVGASQLVRPALIDPSEPCILLPEANRHALDERLNLSSGVLRLSLGGGAFVDVNTTSRWRGRLPPDENSTLAGSAVKAATDDGDWPCVKPTQLDRRVVLGTTFLRAVAVEWDRSSGAVRVKQREALPHQPCVWSPPACAAGVSSLLLDECRSTQCEIAFASPQQCSTIAFGAGIGGLVAGVPLLVGAAVAWCLVVPALAAARG